MRILVIGGTGFIGPHVVQRLVELQHDVTLFNRGRKQADSRSGVSHIPGDRRRLGDFSDAFRDASPDVVLDMWPGMEQQATDLMVTFRGIVDRVVAISSMDVYRAFGNLNGIEPGPVDSVPLDESAPLRTRFYPYRSDVPRGADDPQRVLDDYDKILVEQVVRSDPSIAGTILRLPMVFGPGDYQHRLFPYLKRMDDGRPAILLCESEGRWRVTRGYVENVAAAIALTVTDDRSAGNTYNVGEAEPPCEIDWVREVGRAAGWGGRVVMLPGDQLPEHLRSTTNFDQDVVVDTSRIRHELGYAEPVSREEALQRAIAWARVNQPTTIDEAQFDYAAEDTALATQ